MQFCDLFIHPLSIAKDGVFLRGLIIRYVSRARLSYDAKMGINWKGNSLYLQLHRLCDRTI